MYFETAAYMYIWDMELTEKEKGNFGLFAANGKRKPQTSVSLQETENESLVSLVGK